MHRRLVASLFLLTLACEDQDPAPTGEAQGPCYPNGTCNEGLVCASDLCVDLDAAETESGRPDICGSWECLSGTAGQVACVHANDCEAIHDGVCVDGMQC